MKTMILNILARPQQKTANDNRQQISAREAEQLADIMAFTAKRRNASLAVMTAELCLAFGVGYLGNLRSSQFRPALDYVLTYRANRAA